MVRHSASSLKKKISDWPEIFSRDKYSSLFGQSIIDDEKGFVSLTPGHG
jgi:hypothetical protein